MTAKSGGCVQVCSRNTTDLMKSALRVRNLCREIEEKNYISHPARVHGQRHNTERS